MAEKRLRVLVADGASARVDEVSQTIEGIGHEVVARVTDLATVGALSRSDEIDVAFVIVDEETARGLDTIEEIAHEAACPVVAVIDAEDREFVNKAARRGAAGYVTSGGAAQMQSSIDVVLRRFAQYHDLEGAFARRALTERAKGVLMERHRVGEHEAFEMLRAESRRRRIKLIDVAQTLLDGYLLLPGPPREEGKRSGGSPGVEPRLSTGDGPGAAHRLSMLAEQAGRAMQRSAVLAGCSTALIINARTTGAEARRLRDARIHAPAG
jgi:two-component system, response regulator / RNA-binding antiterminator